MWIFILIMVLLVVLVIFWASKVKEIKQEIVNLKQTFDKKLTFFYHEHRDQLVLDAFSGSRYHSWNRYNAFLQELLQIAHAIEEKNVQLSKLNSNQSQSEILSDVRLSVSCFETQTQAIGNLASLQMFDPSDYGHINKGFWDTVQNMNRHEVDSIISKYTEAREYQDSYRRCILLDPQQILQCVWFFACEKPYSATAFSNACNLFHFIYKQSHNDLLIAELYAKKQLGGENVLQNAIRSVLQYGNDPDSLMQLASGCMWMNAYHCENTILQHMLSRGMDMTEKAQLRLYSLTNGGGKAPVSFDVSSSSETIFFDVSALAWKDDEYIGLFENLAFQDKPLSYSLAVRDEDKDLFISHNLKVPTTFAVLEKFKRVFAEEYASGVIAKAAKCTALSGSGEEQMEGILVSSNECKQMGILIQIARIGKKLIIKFYTLFMPTGNDLAVQKQQALSMYKKLSPSVTMWENSLKATMLMAVEQLLNSTQSTGNTSDSTIHSDEPIF